MLGEVDILGVFIPTVLVLMLIAHLLNMAIGRVLSLFGAYRHVWHRSIFDLARYVLVFAAISFLYQHL